MKTSEKIRIALIAALVFFAAFAGHGWLRDNWMRVTAITIALICMVQTLAFPPATVSRTLRQLARDPLVYFIALFLLLITVQWANSDRKQVLDRDANAYVYEAPPIPWLPSSIERKHAVEPFITFLPAFIIALCIRHGLKSTRAIRALWLLLGTGVTLQAIIAIVTLLLDIKVPCWPKHSEAFGGFGYRNHAADFLLIAMSFTIGNLLRTNSPLVAHRYQWRRAGLVLSIITICATIHLARAMAGAMLCWTLVALAILYHLVSYAHLSHGAMFNTILFLLLGAASLWMLTTSDSHQEDMMRQEVHEELGEQAFAHNIDQRLWQYRAAIGIFLDHRWFGTGAAGYNFSQAFYIPPERFAEMKLVGCADVHNDFLEFLAEYGAIGTGLLCLAVATLALPLFFRPLWHPCLFPVVLAIPFIMVHSVVDLPFRSPPIVYIWTVALAGASQYARELRAAHAKERVPAHDKPR